MNNICFSLAEQRRNDECVDLEARHVPDMYDCDDSDMEEIEPDDYAQFFDSNVLSNPEIKHEVQDEFQQKPKQLPEKQIQLKKVVKQKRKRSEK